MARILITGGSGFIGARVAAALAARGDTVVSFDTVVGPEIASLAEANGRVTTVTGTLTEWPHVADAVRIAAPDAIVHCAAVVGVVNSLASPVTTMRVNVEGSLHVLECMRLFGVRRLVNLSTEEIYGHFTADLIDEEHPCRPIAPYGITKFAVEQLARDHARTHGLECIHVRTPWVYGPRFPRPRAPMTMLDAALAGRPLHMARGGDFVVDHVHVDDTVAGILLALDKPDHRYDAYHIATGTMPSLAEIAAIIRALVPGSEITVGPGPYYFGDKVAAVRKGALAIDRARAELGYAPRHDIRSGIAAYIAEAVAGPR